MIRAFGQVFLAFLFAAFLWSAPALAQADACQMQASSGSCQTTTQIKASGLVGQGERQVIEMVCKVHQKTVQMVGCLKAIGKQKNPASDARSIAVSGATKVLAFIALLLFAYALIVVVLQVFEVIVRLAVYTALAPLILYCYIYPNTRHIFDNAVKGYIYATLKFSLLGAFLAAGLLIAKTSLEAVQSFASTIQGMGSITSSDDLAKAISYAGVAFVTGLMIGRVMSAASSTAAAMSGYAYANLGVATGGVAALKSVGSNIMGMGAAVMIFAPAGLRAGIGKLASMAKSGGVGGKLLAGGVIGAAATGTAVGAGGILGDALSKDGQPAGDGKGPSAPPPAPGQL